jgi:hypothetical protein
MMPLKAMLTNCCHKDELEITTVISSSRQLTVADIENGNESANGNANGNENDIESVNGIAKANDKEEASEKRMASPSCLPFSFFGFARWPRRQRQFKGCKTVGVKTHKG